MKDVSAWHIKKRKPVSWTARFLFPFMVVLFAGILAPISVPLIGALMFGNMLKVSGVVDSLASTAQNELANLVTLFLGITVGATMTAENILTLDVLKILILRCGGVRFRYGGRRAFCKVGKSLPEAKAESHDRRLWHFRVPHVGARCCQDGFERRSFQFHYPACHGRQCGGTGRFRRRRRPCACSYSRFVIKEEPCQV